MALPDLELLRTRLRWSIREEAAVGIDVGDLQERLAAAPGYDALAEVAADLAALPALDGEPDDLAGIWAEADPARALAPVAVPDAADRARAAFTGSLVGNMLGKPVEIVASLAGLRDHLEPLGEWPIADYLTEASVRSLWVVAPQWPELVRERIDHVAADDDVSYTVLGMRVLEDHGPTFTHADLTTLWLQNLPPLMTFGPERTFLVAAAAAALDPTSALPEWVAGWNPNKEWCGALIRADAYGYACLGDPALAAQLAWRDASLTHRRTGLYGTMFVAAAIAAMPTAPSALDGFRVALG